MAAPDTTAWLDQGLRDVPHPGEVIRAEHPICTVLATAATRARCRAALQSEAKRIVATCTPIPARRAGGETEAAEDG
jgi:predicted ATP-grasp superfamily ATP-dependent carboligase